MGLRLLHAIASMNPSHGGPVEGVRQLSAVNHMYGHTIEVVCFDRPDDPWVLNSPQKVHALGPARGGYGFLPRYVQWLREHAAEYDMVIINGIWGFNAFGAWLALRNSTVPYGVFTHGMLDPWFRYRYPIKHIKKWLYWPWGLYPVLRDADAVFFTCEREAILARESFWLYDCNEIVIRYGTAGIPDFDHDYRSEFFAQHPSLEGKRNFLFFGRVHPKKGPDLMLKAIGRLKKEGFWDERTMRAVMAGPADGGYANSLREIASRADIEESVYWTGMLSGNQKWGVLQMAEAFVLPSHQENFGIAVAEALSAGTPVLTTHGVNISAEIAVDGAGLVDEDTVEGTCRLFRKWLSIAGSEGAAMRAQARKTFLTRYTADVGAKDLMRSVYLILGSRKAAEVSGFAEKQFSRL